MIKGNTIRVVLIEDIEDLRESLRLLINGAAGFSCIPACGNAEQVLNEIPENMDVVLMDIHLPGMNGIECVNEMKPKMPETQFKTGTMNDDDDNVITALPSGGKGQCQASWSRHNAGWNSRGTWIWLHSTA
jgi:DNA-binding NarL/FixJ family response regulator